MTERSARLVLGAIVLALCACALRINLATLSGGEFWGDGATYYSMSQSLVEDGDLRYEARDVLRARREFSSGPQGLFLKRASGGLMWDSAGGFPWVRRVPASEPRIYFGKAILYSLAAAPFVKLFGTSGLLLTNALFLGLVLWLAYGEWRRQASPGLALLLTLLVILGTVTPIYLIWPAPEVFTLGLVTAGLVAWRREWPLLSALLLGLATYAKPPNILLALPLGFAPLIAASGAPISKRLFESLRRGVVLGATIALCFGLNVAVTGELNYQGGERKTFYGRFPFETHGVTFDNSGFWMTTEHFGPLVEGKDEELKDRRTGPLLSALELRGAFLANLGYFWIGRFGGAVPYFLPVVLAVALFLLAGPREANGWLALASLLASYVLYIWQIPANWYGGAGAVGNRYFLNLVPLVLFLVPRGFEKAVAVGGLVGAAALAPLIASPMLHTLRPWLHTTRAPFRYFPLELTELNDLSIFLEPWRKKNPVGDTRGDDHKRWPPDPAAYWLYFSDDGVYGMDEVDGERGFRLRPGERAEVVVRALEPVRRLTLQVRGGGAGNEVEARVSGRSQALRVGPDETATAVFEPGGGLLYYDSFLYVLKFRSGNAGPVGERPFGPFIRIVLEVEKRKQPG